MQAPRPRPPNLQHLSSASSFGSTWGIPGTVLLGQGDVVPPGPRSCAMSPRFPVADRPGSRRLDMGRAGEGRRQPHPLCLWPQQSAAPRLTLGHQPALPDLPGSQRGSKSGLVRHGLSGPHGCGRGLDCQKRGSCPFSSPLPLHSHSDFCPGLWAWFCALQSQSL